MLTVEGSTLLGKKSALKSGKLHRKLENPGSPDLEDTPLQKTSFPLLSSLQARPLILEVALIYLIERIGRKENRES